MQTLASAEAAVDSRYDSWQVPEEPVTLVISHEMTRAIAARASRRFGRLWGRGNETGGLLLGTVRRDAERTTVTVDHSVEVPSEHLFGPSYSLSANDKGLFRETLDQLSGAGGEFQPVGFYRTQTRRGLSLDAEDELLLSECFDAGVALLVERRAIRPKRAGLFFWENGAVRPGAGNPEIRPVRKPGRRPASAAGPKAPLWCSWWVQAPLLLCLLFADGLLGFFSARPLHDVVRIAPVQKDPYALSLLVVEYGDSLHLTWDRLARPLARAEFGVLVITDGGQTRSTVLTPAQLRIGSVTYRKVTNQVRFRLEIVLKGHGAVSEGWASADTGGPLKAADAKQAAETAVAATEKETDASSLRVP